VFSSNFLATSIGRGAPPDPHPRTDDRSNLFRQGWLVKATKIVGTAAIIVTLYCSTAFRTSVNGGLPARGSGMQTKLLPVKQAQCITTLQPKLWYMGSTPKKQCAPPLFNFSGGAPGSLGMLIHWSRAVTLKTIFACVKAAPLGTPVVPPV